jgi:hypothetical protein
MDEGISKRLAAGAMACVATGLAARDGQQLVQVLNTMLERCRLFPGPRGSGRLPPTALFQWNAAGASLIAQFTSAEMAACVPVFPFLFARYPAISKLFQVWADLYNEIRSPMPSWDGARKSYQLYQWFLRAFTESGLQNTLAQGLHTPTSHDIVHLVEQTIFCGATDVMSLNGMENSHIRCLKDTFAKTDKRKFGIEVCIADALRKREAQQLSRVLLARHYSSQEGLSDAVREGWQRHAGLLPAAPPRQLRGKGKRADLPPSMPLASLALKRCTTPVGFVDLQDLPTYIDAAMQLVNGSPTLRAGVVSVSLDDELVPFTSCLVVGAGRQQCVESRAFARPLSGPSSEAVFDFVAFPEADDTAVVERYGLLALIFTLGSVEQPLCLVRMLRQEPPGVNVYAPLPPRHTPRSRRLLSL